MSSPCNTTALWLDIKDGKSHIKEAVAMFIKLIVRDKFWYKPSSEE